MKSNVQGLLVGQLIASIVAALLLFLDDFAGFYYRAAGVDVWGYVYLGSGFLATVLISLAGLGYGYSALLALKMIKGSSVKKLGQKAFKPVLVSLSITVIGAVVFASSNIIDGTQEWWFDAGFYGSLVGGSLALFFIKQIKEQK